MGRVKTAEEIQEAYTESKGYSTFIDLLLDEVNAINWHVENVQKEYARQCTDQELTLIKIQSVRRTTDGEVFSIGDTVKFSDRYDSFILDKIIHDTNERRLELHGNGLFCTLMECECKVIKPLITS